MIIPFTIDEPEINLLHHRVEKGLIISAQIADIHMGAIDPKTQYEIIRDQIVNVLKGLPKLDIISLNGDLFDHKVQTSSEIFRYTNMVIEEFVNVCRERNAVLVIIEGTARHDANQLSAFSNYLLDNTVDVRIVENIQFEYIKGLKVLCIPELYGLEESIYIKYLFESGIYDYCFMHGTIKGSIYGDTVGNGRLFTIEDFTNCTGPIFAGHVHTPGCFDKHFYYSGTPIRYKHGEEETKGFFIVAHDLESGFYNCHFQEVKSFKYTTIIMEELISNDPKDIINRIDELKRINGIDNIRIIFDMDIPSMSKSIINNYYRNNKDVIIKYSDIEKEKIKKETEDKDELKEYSFILDDSYTDEEKFVMYCNAQKGEEFITVEELKSILSVEI